MIFNQLHVKMSALSTKGLLFVIIFSVFACKREKCDDPPQIFLDEKISIRFVDSSGINAFISLYDIDSLQVFENGNTVPIDYISDGIVELDCVFNSSEHIHTSMNGIIESIVVINFDSQTKDTLSFRINPVSMDDRCGNTISSYNFVEVKFNNNQVYYKENVSSISYLNNFITISL